MKKDIIFIAFLITLAIFWFTAINKPSQAEPVETRVAAWTNIRSTDANDPNASVPTAWASVPSHSYRLKYKSDPPLAVNNIIIRFRFSSGDGTTANYYISTRQYGDDSEFVCSGVATAGTFAATAGGTYADTITITSERHIKDVVSTDETGNNEMARIGWDGCGGEQIEIKFDDISAGTVYVDIRDF